MFFDYYLKFTDETEAMSILYSEENIANYPNIDIIGTITKQISEEELITLDGFHVNVRSDKECTELDQYSVTVNTPYRVWG